MANEIPSKDPTFDFEAPTNISGNGWKGKKFYASNKNNEQLLQVLAIDDSSSEMIRLVTTDDTESGQRFFESLEVYPDRAKAKFEEWNRPVAFRRNVAFGVVLSGLIAHFALASG